MIRDSRPPSRAERMARLAEVLVDVDDRIAAEDAAAATGEASQGLPASALDLRSEVTD